MFGQRINGQIVNPAVVVTGDELLLDCLLEFIRKATLQTDGFVMSGDPEGDRKAFRVGLVQGGQKLLRVDRSFFIRCRHADRNQHVGTIAELLVFLHKGT